MPMQLSAFPKCYLDDIVAQRMSVFEWIDQARALDAEGLEMYSGFLTELSPPYLDKLRDAIAGAGFAMPMFCCSPDFTIPDADARRREIEREADMIRVARHLGGPRVVCRILSGQAHPDVSWEQGREWVINAIRELLPVAREHHVILGMENHYKDGFWRYPEFAQKMERFVSIVDAIEDRDFFGVQYDPSNAIVAEDNPIELLERVAGRVVSMHASDRYLQAGELRHGVTGQGLNDYPRIFGILKASGYAGWISIEDGMNGMEEMQASLHFLRVLISRPDESGAAD